MTIFEKSLRLINGYFNRIHINEKTLPSKHEKYNRLINEIPQVRVISKTSNIDIYSEMIIIVLGGLTEEYCVVSNFNTFMTGK